MAKQQTNKQQMRSEIYSYGTLGGELTGYKTMSDIATSGITKTNATTFTIITPGLYLFYAQQLMQTTSASNFFSQVNGVSVHHGWQPVLQTDMVTSFVRPLNAGDTVRLYVDTGVAANWTGDHSTFYLVRIW